MWACLYEYLSDNSREEGLKEYLLAVHQRYMGGK